MSKRIALDVAVILVLTWAAAVTYLAYSAWSDTQSLLNWAGSVENRLEGTEP